MLNSLVIDSEGEDYSFKTFQFAGVTDVVSASCNLLSAISNIPQTILFGRSVNGLSSTDDTSMENWYNYIERIDKRMVKPNLRYLLSVVFQAGVATGEIEEVPKIKVKFNPLWSMSDTEQAALEQTRAQTKQAKAQTAQIYVEMGALDPSEVRGKLADSEEFDVEDILEGDNENLFAGMETQLEQEALADVKGHIAEEGDFDDYGENVDLEAAQAPVGEGNSSEAAPAATKLPQDMNEGEQEEAEAISRGDGGPGSGNFGHEGRAGQVGGSLGELAMTAQGYSDPRQFIHENIKAIKAQGIKKPADAIAYWKDACYAKDIKPHETGVEEAIETIRYNVPSSTLHGWFVEANSTYKGRLEQAALSNDEVRNAGLNIAYENFKSLQRGKSDASISFDQFLDRPITVYRGKASEHFVDGDDILSFSMDRKVAEKFAGANGKVVSTEIKPRDTIGSYQTTGEAEILVRRGNIHAAGYDGFNADAEWRDPVFWSEELEELFEQEVGEEKRGDGGPGSGNWGHTGVKGQLGGSAPGGGVSKRTGSKETGFSSEAKERAKAKAGGGSGSGGSTKNEGSKTSTAPKSSMTLDKSPGGALATDNDGEAWKKTDSGDFMNLQSGEVVSADELGEFGGSVVEYTGKTDFPQGSVSQETMNQRLWGINEKEIAEKGYAETTSEDLEEMVGAVTHYGLGGDCQMMLATQDPDAYPDIMRTMSDDKKKSYGAEMEQVERFIAVSPKADYPVYRGVSFNDEMHPENAQRVLSQLKVGQEISMGHVASWSSGEGTARSYAMGAVDAEFGTGQDYSVVYRVAKPKSAVSLSGINPEGEHLTPRSARFRVNRVNHAYDDDLECHCYTVDMEEV